MAFITSYMDMFPIQRKMGLRVIEARDFPVFGLMARFALCGAVRGKLAVM
jgi:hypothetical protein